MLTQPRPQSYQWSDPGSLYVNAGAEIDNNVGAKPDTTHRSVSQTHIMPCMVACQVTSSNFRCVKSERFTVT